MHAYTATATPQVRGDIIAEQGTDTAAIVGKRGNEKAADKTSFAGVSTV